MKLIRIEAIGFKSFANRIALNFNGDVVGIVGPNGSGKSNVNDAIKWVLGEQSKKNLRSDSMEDVIFSGSKGRVPMNYAEVSLTFDNSDKLIDIPHKKIVISRRLERGSTASEYFINGESARLKDLTAIVMESGVGKSSLAIISQGTVSSIAESSPEDRRFIFEETAGISHYRVRKREAMSKLEKTTENLSKLELVTDELGKQLKSLRSQSKKASLFVETNEKLKDIEVSLLAHDIRNYSKRLIEINDQLKTVIAERESLTSRLDQTQTQTQSKSEYKFSLDKEIQTMETELSSISEKLMQLELRYAKLNERRKLLLQDKSKTGSSDQLEALKEEIHEYDAKIKVLNQWNLDLKTAIETKKTEGSQINEEVAKLRINRFAIQEKMYKLKSQREILADYESNRTNLFKGTKTILDNQNSFPGVHDIVGNIIKVDKEYEMVIETVLKNALQHIVVNSPEDAIKAVAFLKKNQSGSATFIPLSVIRSKSIDSQIMMAAQSVEGFIGEARTLVQIDEKYNILNDFLLGGVLVTENIEQAKELAALLNFKYLTVSLDGDLIRPGGTITGGQNVKEQSVINLTEKIKRIDEYMPVIEEQYKKIDVEIASHENTLNQISSMKAELSLKIDKNIETEKVIKAQFEELKVRFGTLSKEKLEIENVDDIPMQIQKLEVAKSDIKTSLTVKRTEVIKCNEELQMLTMIKFEIEAKLFKLNENSSSQLNEKNKLEFYVKKSHDRLVSQYETTYESIKDDFFKQNIDVDRARKDVQQLRSTLKDLGNVNIQSIKDHEEIDARYLKLMESQKELEEARKIIVSAIDEMDSIMISKFDVTVKGIEVHFQKIFAEMFGGGLIKIRYVDPENLLETGIDIIAQPPGKTVRSLKLFSGGEKSLIAISLLFAILEYKPLPLCILDEVEASLDEVNVHKFATYLHKLKHKTQFIIVTHRIGTMEKLDILLGATMQTPGITSIFSVEMAQAKEIIEKMDKKISEQVEVN